MEDEEEAAVKYTVVVSKDPESDTFMASVPALSGCHTWGATKEAAFKNAVEAIEVYIAGLRQMGRRPPRDVDQRVAVFR